MCIEQHFAEIGNNDAEKLFHAFITLLLLQSAIGRMPLNSISMKTLQLVQTTALKAQIKQWKTFNSEIFTMVPSPHIKFF